MTTSWFSSPDDAAARLDVDRLPRRRARPRTTAYLAGALEKPLLVEGPAGVGKTELAKAVAAGDRRRAGPAAVLRGPRRGQGALRVELQEAAAAHPGRAARDEAWDETHDDIFTEEFLLTRPLLERDPRATSRPCC